MLLLEVHSCHLHFQLRPLLWKRWPPTKIGMKNVQTHKRGGGMHQLKELDMLSAKMDLLMKKLEDLANEKKEVMHINDYRMTCEECENSGHLGNNCPKIQEDVNFVNNNYYHPQQNQGWNQ
jgi:hypothetical protein